jgi:AcrR family transcriptional regulator
MDGTPEQPKMTRRQRQKAETRSIILDVARNLFEEDGFDATTVRAVAERAGVALGTIFSHFPDKGALLIAAVLDDLAETDRQIMETMPPHAPIREQILHAAAAGFSYWCRRPGLSKTLLREMWFVRGPWGEERRRETEAFIGSVAGLLEDARRRGEIRTDADLAAVADEMYSFYLGRLIRAAAEDDLDAEKLTADAEVFVDHILAGVSPREAGGTDD